MTYIFNETENEAFWLRISVKFWKIFFENVLYIIKNDMELEKLFPDGKTLSTVYLGEVYDKHKKDLKLLNCNMFSIFASCMDNVQCKEDHDKNDYKVVLDSDQVDKFEETMQKTMDAINAVKHVIKDIRVRENLQRIMQNTKTTDFSDFEYINIFADEHPDDWKKENPNEYMKMYAEGAKEIADNKAGEKEFVYLCAKKDEGSHLSHFMRNMRSTGIKVKPCDKFQEDFQKA